MLTAKYLRAHNIPTLTSGYAWFYRLMYEFWGFCVNGGDELNTPHGFASGTGVTMPANFMSNGILASGSDGITTAGMPFFNTVSNAFSASCSGKYLVTWKSGSICTDDSVYLITQWINSSSLRVDVRNGGTPYTGSLHPSFTDRTSIKYRVIDFSTITGLTYSTTSSLVLQFNGAPDVNPGQANSQACLRMSSSPKGVYISISPSGSWNFNTGSNVSTFSDPTSEIGGDWFNSSHDSPAYITLIGAGDFLICHYKGQQQFGSGFHIEIPQRLYPQNNDPNPITMMTFTNVVVNSSDGTVNYGGGFYMHNPPNDTTMRYYPMIRRFDGSDITTSADAVNGRYNGAYYNTYQNKFLFTDAILANPITLGQYQMARARLRRARFIAPIIPQFQRIGNQGEWFHVSNGIMWPWDNTILPYNLFLGGT